MAIDSMLVRPGEIITANFMNDLLATIDELRNRVAELEAGGPVGSQITISSFDPPTQVAIGQQLIIKGSNFDPTTENNHITVGGSAVTQFRVGSNSVELRFIVPDIASVPAEGKNVTVRVAIDGKGSDEKLYRVLPRIPVVGNDPGITGITRLANGSTTLRVNDVAVIAGHDFDPIPANNRIKFTVVSIGKAYPDPVTQLPVIVIDGPNSTASSIRVTVPNIAEILAGAEDATQVDVEVGVGAHLAAVRRVSIIRV
jgi:hypothetical protein